jgi:hypothetical protein
VTDHPGRRLPIRTISVRGAFFYSALAAVGIGLILESVVAAAVTMVMALGFYAGTNAVARRQRHEE